MLILRIRQAETALADGRLDEAFELVRCDEVQSHRQGQKLIGRLARALVDRGRTHLGADRLTQASGDCDKAMRLAGNLPEAAALKAAIAEAVQGRQRADRRQADLLATAKQHIRDGRLSIGERMLADCESDAGQVKALREEVAAARAGGETLITRAKKALARKDWAEAIDALAEARQAHVTNAEVAELTGQTADLVVEEAGLSIDQGRLDLAESMVGRLTLLSSQTMRTQELSRIIDQCRSAATMIERGQPRRAIEILRRLTALRPGAAWLVEACRRAEEAANSLEHLRGGPLGMLAGGQIVSSTKPAAPMEAISTDKTVPLGRGAKATGEPVGPIVPSRFMLQVDGVGSFLVLRDRRISVGPVSSSHRPELGLLADATLPVATIERVDEDYFLSSPEPIHVGDAPATRKLLADGDRIALGPRCRLEFTLPSAASTSAVVHLSGTRLPIGDVRRVILMGDSIIVGPGSSAHIRADSLAEPTALFVRDGRLFAGGKAEVLVNGRPMDRHAGIPIGSNVSVGGVSFAVTTEGK